MDDRLYRYDLGEGVEAFSTMRDAELPYPVLQPHQTHKTNVAVITSTDTTREDLQDTDALVCDIPGFAIGVRTADCIPVLMYDPVHRAVGAVHAGWRGTVARIAAAAVSKMTEVYGTDPRDLQVQIGPGIGFDSFQVGEELVERFREEGFPMEKISRYEDTVTDFPMSGGWHIDLWTANRFVLEEAGIPSEQIRTAGICTYKRNDLFYSARRETIACPRIINVIKLK
uniref:Purine nucleoside phosphorylase n=1 Tax=uncultured bacterium fosmid pJB89E1 TaxID=1478073 RepID=A0A0H3U8C3_9BACT|nr:hypothetical protein [uncultured bacterium fosmid pJB89E1]